MSSGHNVNLKSLCYLSVNIPNKGGNKIREGTLTKIYGITRCSQSSEKAQGEESLCFL